MRQGWCASVGLLQNARHGKALTAKLNSGTVCCSMKEAVCQACKSSCTRWLEVGSAQPSVATRSNCRHFFSELSHRYRTPHRTLFVASACCVVPAALRGLFYRGPEKAFPVFGGVWRAQLCVLQYSTVHFAVGGAFLRASRHIALSRSCRGVRPLGNYDSMCY